MRLAVILLAIGLSGCYSVPRMNHYVEEVARDVAAVEEGISEETVADATREVTPPVLPGGTLLQLDRQSVLGLASTYSRELQTKRDVLYNQGLSLFGTRRNFGFNVSGTVDFILSGADEEEDREQMKFAAELERILPTGGRARIGGSQDTASEGDEDTTTSSARIRLDQPLLAGAGYTASHEELVQSERDYVYALRNFALDRQGLAIDTLRRYYDLLGQRKVLENTRTNYQQFIYLRERSEALFKVNRAPAIDVLRSQQEELSALNRLTSTEESYRIQVGRFLVNLGLPSETPATLADDIPDMREVTLEEQDAVTLALNRRMDVHTTRDRLADAERKVRVARNAYLPEVNLYGESEWSDRDDGATNANADATTSWEAGIRAEIPFDRRAERDAIRRAEIARDAASRALEEKEENTALEVREAYSRLRSLRVSLDVELKNIEIAEKRATNALLEFRNGRLSNRDVVEAANDLLNAKNAYVNALVDYEIQRLTLLRQVGLLDVAREGTLMELSPDA
jgi:outer membrane protein TolC